MIRRVDAGYMSINGDTVSDVFLNLQALSRLSNIRTVNYKRCYPTCLLQIYVRICLRRKVHITIPKEHKGTEILYLYTALHTIGVSWCVQSILMRNEH